MHPQIKSLVVDISLIVNISAALYSTRRCFTTTFDITILFPAIRNLIADTPRKVLRGFWFYMGPGLPVSGFIHVHDCNPTKLPSAKRSNILTYVSTVDFFNTNVLS